MVKARMNPFLTPPSSSKRKFTANKFVNAGVRAYNVGKAVYTGAKNIRKFNRTFTKTQTGNTKVSVIRNKAGPSGRLAGKQYKGKKFSRALRVKGKLTKRGFAHYGVVSRLEYRQEDDSIGSNESRLVGHNTVPVLETYKMMMRALVKSMFRMQGIAIASFSDVYVGQPAAPGQDAATFVARDQIRVSYYNGWNTLDSSLLTRTMSVNSPAATGTNLTTYTYDDLAIELVNFFLGQNATSGWGEDFRNVRWQSLTYIPWIPLPGVNGIQLFINKSVKIDLTTMSFEVETKSMLKMQNISGNYASGNVPTSEELQNIPVEVSTYMVTGNQLINIRARKSAAVGYNGLGFNQDYTVNTSGAEPRPAYEYVNCTRRDKFTMDPGHIKTSVIYGNHKYTFGDVMRYFITFRGSAISSVTSENTYSKQLGKARFLHVDKVIGKLNTKVRLAIEIEVDQKVVCYATQNQITEQIEFQAGS